MVVTISNVIQFFGVNLYIFPCGIIFLLPKGFFITSCSGNLGEKFSFCMSERNLYFTFEGFLWTSFCKVFLLGIEF